MPTADEISTAESDDARGYQAAHELVPDRVDPMSLKDPWLNTSTLTSYGVLHADSDGWSRWRPLHDSLNRIQGTTRLTNVRLRGC